MTSGSSPTRSARVGTVIANKYRLDRLLGAGGMGSVFEALNTWTERRVALKVLHPELVRNPEVPERFLREARVATKVAHPNIVEVLDMGQDPHDGALYIVQEFLEGQSLRTLLDRVGVLELREAFQLLVPVMSALVAAHAKGVVHRDLKPENVLLAQTHAGVVPKLIDFGIAKITGEQHDKGLTKTGLAMGTPHYMSPEQARGERDIDAQTDVWAVGVLWFEALTARCPYEGDNYNQLLARIITEPVPLLATIKPDVPKYVARAIDRALTKERSERWRSVREFLAALFEAPEVQRESWIAPLRQSYAPLSPRARTAEWLAAPVDHPPSPTPLRVPALREEDAVVHTPTPLSQTTFGSSATTLDRIDQAAYRGGNRAGLVVLALLVLGGLGAAAVALTTSDSHDGAASTGASASSATVLEPLATATARTTQYIVSVAVSPAYARIELDGQLLERTTLVREFARDGSTHRLRVFADGYQPRELTFRDEPPPQLIALMPAHAPSAGSGEPRSSRRSSHSP